MADNWWKILAVAALIIAAGTAVYSVYLVSKRYQYGGHVYNRMAETPAVYQSAGVKLPPPTIAKLNRYVLQSGRPADEVVTLAVARYLRELNGED